MGLDFLDITFRIEKTFDIPLSTDDFDELVQDRDIMVGDLYGLILEKTHVRDVVRHDFRLNYALWTELQAVLHVVTEVPLDRIELKTPLRELFPRDSRRAAWEQLRDACPYRVRELEYPKAVRRTGFALAAAMVLIEQLRIWQLPGVQWLWPVLGILGIWMLAETYMKLLAILRPLRNRFPSGMTSVKDLCRAVLATNSDVICRDVGIPLDDRSLAVWRQLTEILVEALGVEAGEVTFRSRLTRDLGMA